MDNRAGGGTRRPSGSGSDRSDVQFVHFDIKNTSRNEHESGQSRQYQPRSRNTKHRRAPLPLFWVVAIDVLIAAVGLLLYSLFYFILPKDYSGDAITLPAPTVSQNESPSASQPASSAPATASQGSAKPSTTSSQSAAQGMWRANFADKFTSGEVLKDDTSYKSANINVKVEKVQKDGVTYFVSDIYVADIKYFKTAYASGKYQSAGGKHTDEIARNNNAIIAINGDNSPENRGPVIRNGTLHPYKIISDVMVMFNDGTMKTYSPNELDVEKIKTQGAWQAWVFGPMLLKDGQPMKNEEFNSTVKGNPNPRTAIGYYEPGHYCFVAVDGRQPGYSDGMTMESLSKLFADLGCKAAFNVDGGQSEEMAFMGNLVNKPFSGGRPINDIVYIAE